MASDHVLELIDVSRRFRVGAETITILDRLQFVLSKNERVAIMGASGCGKTTLLHLVAGMDSPSSGQIRLADVDLGKLGEPALTRLRARHIGLIFQDFNLIDSLTVAENITLPLWLNRLPEAPGLLGELTETLAISPLLDRLPAALSGGEKQRVAIARALIHEPELILADEPTGSLDEATAGRVLDLFDQVIRQRNSTLLLVTHNREAAALCDKRMVLRNGALQPAE
ncbi:MAG: ABC transporter ATP-binding protein [Wenzhouxiangella sp.]|nr:MAG: ABC transporter ATP-binding protein [Wenzhouxiangella sp.]